MLDLLGMHGTCSTALLARRWLLMGAWANVSCPERDFPPLSIVPTEHWMACTVVESQACLPQPESAHQGKGKGKGAIDLSVSGCQDTSLLELPWLVSCT